MKLGYARVSTDDQNLTVQVEQLKAEGCCVFHEKKSAKGLRERPVLGKILANLEAGDVLVVTKLDRLARSTSDLLAVVERIGNAGASFLSLSEPWADTTSPAGKLIMTVFAGVAQFERERMLERCDAGRARAKREGVRFGRKPKLTAHQRTEAVARLDGGEAVKSVARSYNVDPATIYRLRQTNA